MKDLIIANGFTDAENQIMAERIYKLLSRQTEKYLAGDSTSIPAETAEELMRSIAYTLHIALASSGKSERELLTCDLSALLMRGQSVLKCKAAAAKKLWEQACMTLPKLKNVYLEDTLNGIKGFFTHYDIRYFAHQIPCAIDYPLCVPVSEELLGVSYIEQWLQRLLLENWILNCFQAQAVSRLLSRIAADYADMPLNLCEQTIINASVQALINQPLTLEITAEDCREIEKALCACKDLSTLPSKSAACAAEALHAPLTVQNYMETVLHSYIPRMKAALAAGGLTGIFAAK